jgi:hypothetical protein
MVSEPDISVPLMPKLAIGYDYWQVSSTSYPHNLSPKIHLYITFPFPSVFRTDASPPKFCMHSSPPSPDRYIIIIWWWFNFYYLCAKLTATIRKADERKLSAERQFMKINAGYAILKCMKKLWQNYKVCT